MPAVLLHLNPFALSGILIFVTNAAFAAYVLAKGERNRVNLFWILEALAVALYGFGIFHVARETDPETARFWWRVAHVGVILIPAFYYAFTTAFLGERRVGEGMVVAVLTGFFLVMNLTPHFIEGMRWVFGQFYYDSPAPPLYTLFVAYFVFLLLASHYRLWRASFAGEADAIRQMQAKYFMLATLTGLVGGLTAFLPVFGLDVYPYPNFTVAVYPIVMTYAILRYRLFNVRTVVAEILVAVVWFFLLTRFLLDTEPRDRLIDGLIFLFVLVLGIFLIRSVLGEFRERERQAALANQLQDLASHLQEKVAEQTRTLRERNVRLEALSKQKDEFITLMAHRLRTPLTAVRWIGRLFSEGEAGHLTPKQKEYVANLNAVTEQVINLVNDILNIIRIEEGKFGFTFKPVDLARLVRRAIETHRAEALGKGLILEEDLPALPPITADEEKLAIAFENIVSNAVKYTPRGGRVEISLTVRGETVSVFVKDSGIGIPEKDQPRLFGKFFRSKNAFQIETEGTGLGLYIARNVLRAHGGDVAITSTEGKGTTAVVTLPLRDPSGGATMGETEDDRT